MYTLFVVSGSSNPRAPKDFSVTTQKSFCFWHNDRLPKREVSLSYKKLPIAAIRLPAAGNRFQPEDRRRFPTGIGPTEKD